MDVCAVGEACTGSAFRVRACVRVSVCSVGEGGGRALISLLLQEKCLSELLFKGLQKAFSGEQTRKIHLPTVRKK